MAMDGSAARHAEPRKDSAMVAVGFGSNEFTVGGATPEIGAAGMEEGASEGTERANELAGSLL